MKCSLNYESWPTVCLLTNEEIAIFSWKTSHWYFFVIILSKWVAKLADEVITTSLATILDQMALYTGPKENRLLRNVAAMMFCENPNKFFPYTQIDVVTFPNRKMKGPNNFNEVTFKGSVPQMIKQTMDYIKSNVLKEHVRKVSGRLDAERFWNYPYDAIEEAVVNSVYHRDFLHYEPIEITIEPSGISIANCPGPDRSISKEDIAKGDMLKSRRYQNRKVRRLLKRTRPYRRPLNQCFNNSSETGRERVATRHL